MPEPRIGLSMRVDMPARYDEPRDALAQSWAAFMADALPLARWMPIPNIGAEAGRYARDWELNGFIFTGGNDLGSAPDRDTTEEALLHFALDHDLPVFGVCRGFQFLLRHFGHTPLPCRPAGAHAGRFHEITLKDPPFNWPEPRLRVNSFHHYCGPAASDLRAPLAAFAMDEAGRCEGFYHTQKRIMAVMWHPERHSPEADFNRTLLRHFFGHAGAQTESRP